MKILYYHQYFTTTSGSGGTRSYEMARRLAQGGHDVTVVCGSGAASQTGLSGPFTHGRREGWVEGIKVIELDLPYSNYLDLIKRAVLFGKFALKSTLLALTEEADLIFATSTPLTAGIPGIIAKIFKGKSFVFEVRDLWPELPKAMKMVTNPLILFAMDVLEWCSYHAATACIGLAPGIVAGISKRGIANKKIELIPNGCDLDFFKPNPRIKRKWLTMEIENDDFVALFCGAHGKANGLHAVLDAAAVLISKGRNDIKFLFVGDGKEKPSLMQRAREENLSNCLFVPPIPKNQMPELMNQVDVGLMILENIQAFYNGTSPNKFFDYIASGLPVLNNYPGWLAELVNRNECGIVVPPGDAEAFAIALIKMADDKALTGKMGINARALAEREFDRDVLGAKFVEWLMINGSNNRQKTKCGGFSNSFIQLI
jgi:glycosyltransferase involved in cell wall biosynthesis